MRRLDQNENSPKFTVSIILRHDKSYLMYEIETRSSVLVSQSYLMNEIETRSWNLSFLLCSWSWFLSAAIMIHPSHVDQGIYTLVRSTATLNAFPFLPCKLTVSEE